MEAILDVPAGTASVPLWKPVFPELSIEQTFGMNLEHVCCMFWHDDMLACLCYDEYNALKTFKRCL